jgi:hypothetical protein
MCNATTLLPPATGLSTVITTVASFGKLVAASLLCAPAAFASEAAPTLAASTPVTANPLELGAPPAWGLLLLGGLVVGLTILRRVRKTVPERVPRR